MAMAPELLFRSTEPDNEQIGIGVGHLAKRVIVLAEIAFEADRGAMRADHADIGVAPLDVELGALSNSRCCAQGRYGI